MSTGIPFFGVEGVAVMSEIVKCTDDDLKQFKKLLKIPIEDTQFYQGYPERCKQYARAMKALLARLEAAEKRITPGCHSCGCARCLQADELWRTLAGKDGGKA